MFNKIKQYINKTLGREQRTNPYPLHRAARNVHARNRRWLSILMKETEALTPGERVRVNMARCTYKGSPATIAGLLRVRMYTHDVPATAYQQKGQLVIERR